MKVLPVTYPIITSYQSHTTALSIITTVKEQNSYLPWFCENFIQLRVIADLSSRAWLDFYTFLYSSTYICPFLEFQHLNKNTILNCNPNIAQFLINAIESDYYAYLVVDYQYISISPSYKTNKYPHPIFIYGYDLEKELFYVGDFFGGKFEFSSVSFFELIQAFEHVSPEDFSFEGVKLIRHKPEAISHFDLPNVTELLGDYLFSRDTRNRYRSLQTIHPLEAVGMDPVYLRLNADLENHLDNPAMFHLTSFHVLYEHKKALSITLSFMKEQGYLNGDYDFGELERKSLLLCNVIHKYRITKNLELPKKAIHLLNELHQMEKMILTSVWEELST